MWSIVRHLDEHVVEAERQYRIVQPLQSMTVYDCN